MHALPAPHPSLTQHSPPPAPGWRSRRRHEVYLQGLWAQLMGSSHIGLDTDFFESGGDSLLAAQLLEHIRHSTGQELTFSALQQSPTIRQLARAIDTASWETPAPVVQLRPGTGRPFFLVHSLAGHFLELSAVLRALDTARPVYGLQARGAGVGQVPHMNVVDMASEYIQHMRRVQGPGPYDVGGYSFGGLVAFEIAQQLCRAGETVGLLSLIDTHVHGRFLPPRQWLKQRASRSLATLRTVKSLPPGQRVRYVQQKSFVLLDRLRAWMGLPPKRLELVGDLVGEANFAPSIRRVRGAMLYATRGYRPQPYPGKVVFFRASEAADYADPLPVWREVVRGGLDVRPVPGSHEQMIEGANAVVLAQALGLHL